MFTLRTEEICFSYIMGEEFSFCKIHLSWRSMYSNLVIKVVPYSFTITRNWGQKRFIHLHPLTGRGHMFIDILRHQHEHEKPNWLWIFSCFLWWNSIKFGRLVNRCFFSSNILDILRKHLEISSIIDGDFNCTLTPQDKLGGAAVKRKNNVIRAIPKLCGSLKFQDVWRYQHPDESQFTWCNKAFKVQCRLDYWLVYEELSRIVLNTEMKSSTLTDHSAITLKLQSKGYAQRGPRFWKFWFEFCNPRG